VTVYAHVVEVADAAAVKRLEADLGAALPGQVGTSELADSEKELVAHMGFEPMLPP
jgi:cell wall assembly regulator SMI1